LLTKNQDPVSKPNEEIKLLEQDDDILDIDQFDNFFVDLRENVQEPIDGDETAVAAQSVKAVFDAKKSFHQDSNRSLEMKLDDQKGVIANEDELRLMYETEIENNINRHLEAKTMEILDECLRKHKKLFTLAAQEKYMPNMKANKQNKLRKRLENEIIRANAMFETKISKSDSSQQKKSQKAELKFRWDEAANSPYPTEKIHISEAPPTPKNPTEAIEGLFSKYFHRAMLMEMESFVKKGVFELETLPEGHKAINSKWVFAYKTDPEGFIQRFKARLVAIGSSQIKNQDYKDTHSPVVKIKVIRILLALAALLGINVDQVDVDVAYLHGELQETNYMKLPPGFRVTDQDGKPYVAKLIKSVYGLHQSGREWYKVLKTTILQDGFTQLKSDPCAFIKIDPKSGKLVIVLIYVDDILIASADQTAVTRFKEHLKARFAIKDIGDVEWILRIQVLHTPQGLWIGQKNYAISVLKEFNCWDVPSTKFKTIPMTPGWTHDPSNPKLADDLIPIYRGIIARVMYLAQQTRPDLLYTVNVLAQYQIAPTQDDLQAAFRMLLYLRKTYDWGLLYRKSDDRGITVFESEEITLPSKTTKGNLSDKAVPACYADASFAQEDDRKSRSGYLFMFLGCPVAWYSKKQATTSLSSTEAEINALIEGLKETIWFRNFLEELGFGITKPTTIHQDNKSVIAIAINPVHHSRVKHIEIKTHFIREHLDNQDVKLVYCPSELMIADILTKALPPLVHHKFCKLMGLCTMPKIEEETRVKAMLINTFQ